VEVDTATEPADVGLLKRLHCYDRRFVFATTVSVPFVSFFLH
jgi:hypothetical protein